MKWRVDVYGYDVYGYDTAYFEADTKDKARYRAFRSFREAFGHHISFRDFLARGVRVAPAEASC
jgi:hypothetical protein